MKNDEIFDKTESFDRHSDTLCSERASRHGLHQRVIAVSAYRSNEDNIDLREKILSYTKKYILEAEHFYPDWRVRVYYHNLNMTFDEMIQLEKRFPNVDFCDACNIPFLGNVTSYMSGRFHRFIPLADRFVDAYMSRDVDSPILQREVQSVDEWTFSDKSFHIMRDHPDHYDVILAGLWALKIGQEQRIRNELRNHLLSKSLMRCYNPMTGDQDFLKDYLWPIAEKQSIQHDSFHCHEFPFAIPFTIPKRSPTQFVGCRRPCRADQDPPGPCPILCQIPNNTNTFLC